MIFFLKKITAILLACVNVLTFPVFGWFSGEFSPKDENCLLNFAAISDAHVDGTALNAFMLDLVLADMEKADTRLDALVITGDVTDHGYLEQWEKVYGTMSKYDPADEIVLAVGNHDTWTEDDGIVLAKKYFIDYNRKIAGREIDNMYYSTEINGYSFIVMGSEYDHTDAYISPEQLAWLDAEMAKAAEKNLPIFVISHWPLNQTHGLPESWGDDEPEPDDGGFGDQSDEVEAILKKYENVFLLSGHIHTGYIDDRTEGVWGYKSFESDGSFHSINLPSVTYFNARGELFSGKGYQMEVYEDYVLIRQRSYSGGAWYTFDEYRIDLV